MLSGENIDDFMTTNFEMRQFHGWSLHELESMMPWERRIYIAQLNAYIKKKNQDRENNNNGAGPPVPR